MPRLRGALLRQREAIVEENRRREAEQGGAEGLERPAERGAEKALRFELHRGAARSAGLGFSARLLRLAAEVRPWGALPGEGS